MVLVRHCSCRPRNVPQGTSDWTSLWTHIDQSFGRRTMVVLWDHGLLCPGAIGLNPVLKWNLTAYPVADPGGWGVAGETCPLPPACTNRPKKMATKHSGLYLRNHHWARGLWLVGQSPGMHPPKGCDKVTAQGWRCIPGWSMTCEWHWGISNGSYSDMTNLLISHYYGNRISKW